MAGAAGATAGVGDELDAEDAREAVRRHLEKGEAPPAPGASNTWPVTRRTLVTGRIVRTIESRKEKPEREPGDFDLSGRQLYDVLRDHRLDPPQGSSKPKPRLLVKRGSEAVEPCSPSCDGGRVRCPQCSGRRTVYCEPRTDCPACAGSDSCLNCRTSGGAADGAAYVAASPVRTDKRFTCVNCKKPGVACRSCLGAGEVDCLDCAGEGRRECPRCDPAGTVRHDDCDGRGSFTTWTGGEISWRRETRRLRWPPRGVSWWTWNIARRRGSWSETVLDGGAGLASVDGLDDAAVKGLAPRMAKEEGEVASKATLALLPLFRVDVPLLPHRVLYAHPAPSTHPEGVTYGVFSVPSRQRTLQIAAAALGALAVLVLLRWLLVP